MIHKWILFYSPTIRREPTERCHQDEPSKKFNKYQFYPSINMSSTPSTFRQINNQHFVKSAINYGEEFVKTDWEFTVFCFFFANFIYWFFRNFFFINQHFSRYDVLRYIITKILIWVWAGLRVSQIIAEEQKKNY